MKVSRKDSEALTTVLDITLEKSDYLDKYNNELKKIRQKAAMKGFRQGKTPMSIVRKMYGQQVLAETINSLLQEKMTKAVEDEKIDLVTSPIMTEDQVNYDFDPKNLEDYTFSFEMGMIPEIDLKGADESSSITTYKILVDEDIVSKEFDLVRKRMGSEVEVEKEINNEDRVTIEAVELDDKGKVVKKGWETSFQVLVNTMDEKYIKAIEGKDVGFEFDFDINEIEKNRDEKYVKKYLLNLDEEEEKEIGNSFHGKIANIIRIELAEVNQEFLDKYLGEGVVTSEEEAKDKIRGNIGGYYDGQVDVFLHRNIMDKLIEENNFELPEPFLKRWIKSNNEGVSDEQIDKEFAPFLENVKWDIISGKLRKDLDVKVEEADVRNKVRAQIMKYLGGQQMPGMDIESIVDNMMKDQGQVDQAYKEASSEKLLGAVAEKITLVEEEISIEKFGEMVKEMNDRINPGK